MAATGAVPVRVAQVPSLSGGSKVPAMVCRSLMARPSCSAGRVRVKAYQGSSRHALGLHEALAHRPVSGLAEVAPLGVLGVGPAGEEGDAAGR